MVHVHIQTHADGVGGHQEVDLAGLEEGHLGVAGAGGERAHHHRRSAPLAPDQLGHGVDLLGGEGDHGGAAGQARQLLRPGVGERREPLPRDDLHPGQEPPDERPHGGGAQEHGLMLAAGVQQAVGEHMSPRGIGAELDLVHGQELDRPVQGHGLHGADEIDGAGRDDLLFAGDQGDGPRAAELDNPVVHLPRQEPQRQADHARGVAQHPLDRQVGLAGVGGPEDGDQAGGGLTGWAVAHGSRIGDSPDDHKRDRVNFYAKPES